MVGVLRLGKLLAATLVTQESSQDPQTIKVIGAGFGRTSTDSLRQALDVLGYKTYHMSEVVRHGDAGTLNAFLDGGAAANATVLHGVLSRRGYNATVDWPLSLWYERLLEVNASAKVVLSVRDSPQVWALSFRRTIGSADRFPGPRNAARAPWRYLAWMRDAEALCARVYAAVGLRHEGDDPTRAFSEASAIAAYEAWIAKVRARVPAAQLLVHNAKEGYAPLCAFLGVAGCDRLGPYPHGNSTADLLRAFAVLNFVADAYPVAVAALALWLLARPLRRRRRRRKAD